MNLFESTQIRSAWDETSNKRWFSVVDICAALMGSDYQRARNYWKWLKHKLDEGNRQLVRTANQLKFEAQDGKLRFTDVMDAEEVLRLIQIFPSPKAEAFRLWIAELASEGAAVVKCLEQAVNDAKDTVRHKVGNLIQSIIKEDFNIFGNDHYAYAVQVIGGNKDSALNKPTAPYGMYPHRYYTQMLKDIPHHSPNPPLPS